MVVDVKHNNYGLGLGLTFATDGLYSFQHDGATIAYICAFQAFLTDNSSIVVMSNAFSGDRLIEEALGGAHILANSS